jgi:NADPH-dependent 7-cyano-7-deazaguanine reductase QueF
VSQQKESAIKKNQHSDKNDEEIRNHQLSSPAATSLCPVT